MIFTSYINTNITKSIPPNLPLKKGGAVTKQIESHDIPPLF